MKMYQRLALLLVSTLLVSLLLAACQSGPSGTVPQTTPATPQAPAEPPAPAETQPTLPDYPAPDAAQQQVTAPPETPEMTSEIFMAYPPTPGDENLQRGEMLIDSVTLLPVEGEPGQVQVALEGSLPTPCHMPRVDVQPPDAQNRVLIQAYTLVDASAMCTQVIQPFNAIVATLAGYPAGTYTVVVNDAPSGEFTVP